MQGCDQGRMRLARARQQYRRSSAKYGVSCAMGYCLVTADLPERNNRRMSCSAPIR
ncbi:hypothetical protein PXNS11_250435 [Stutzerimonas xanthomarina]|nr:hypothetical protein PXNS11_250435 [Stutzerimonas xanthomarina]